MSTLYYDEESNEWLDGKPVIEKKTPKILSPAEELIKLKKDLKRFQNDLDCLNNDYHELQKQNNHNKRKANERDNYVEALGKQNAISNNLKVEIIEKQNEIDNFQSKIDTADEKSMIAEADTAETIRKTVIKDGLLKQLRGHFTWRREHPEKQDSHVLNDREIAQIILIIENALKPVVIKR